jgi:hypothetical protein
MLQIRQHTPVVPNPQAGCIASHLSQEIWMFSSAALFASSFDAASAYFNLLAMFQLLFKFGLQFVYFFVNGLNG